MEGTSLWQLLRLHALRLAVGDEALSQAAEFHVPQASLAYSLVDKSYENFRDLFQGLNLVWDVRTAGRGDAQAGGLYCAVYPADDEESDVAPTPVPVLPFVLQGEEYVVDALRRLDVAPFAASLRAYVSLACYTAIKKARPENGFPPLSITRTDVSRPQLVGDELHLPVACVVGAATVESDERSTLAAVVAEFYDLVEALVCGAAAAALGVANGPQLRSSTLLILAATVSYVRRHQQVQGSKFPLSLLEQLAIVMTLRPDFDATVFAPLRLRIEFAVDDADVDDVDPDGEPRQVEAPAPKSYIEALAAFVADIVVPDAPTA
jgi:hypothetical protein